MNNDTKVLKGGSTNRVEHIGDTVHRKNMEHPLLHNYLLFLERVGMPGVPRFLGIDDDGREILSYVPGKTMGPDYPHDHSVLHCDKNIVAMARFMRLLHDKSIAFLPTAIEAGWANPFFPEGPFEVMCHGDG